MCDYCCEWYHIDCLSIDATVVASIEEYKCQNCIDRNNNEAIYEEGKKLKMCLHVQLYNSRYYECKQNATIYTWSGSELSYKSIKS